MTAEMRIESICIMLHEYDQHTGNRGAEGVISAPEKWVDSTYFPFYAAAASMLIEARASMDTHRTGAAGTLAAFKRIIKNCGNSTMKGVFERGGRFCVCDGYRLIRSNADFSSLSHIETTFDAEKLLNESAGNRHPVQLPTVAELKTWLSNYKAKHGHGYGTKALKGALEPYILTYGNGEKIGVNPVYLLDMLQALPGCTATAKSPVSPLYFSAENGDGLLLPVRLKEKAEEKKAA